MIGQRTIAVLKFGGTSLESPSRRALAVRRVADAIADGYGTVAVVSAIGRSPQPYATDSLLQLVGGRAGTRNADVLLAAGELIAAAVFADELQAAGIAATALSGAQAGIVTDEQFGNAQVLRVEPQAIVALLERGDVPVVAGFQGMSENGNVTTLGRGGTDLTAVAIGRALDAARIDIYTDVSGAMTADPRAIPEARTIDRATLEEMSELAQHGATVMHHKAAEYAGRTATRYAIKGLETDAGTIVDDAVVHRRTVTGVTSTGRMTWVRVIRGDLESPTRRMQAELAMFARLADAGMSIDQVTINQAGVAFAVAGDRGNEVRTLLGDLNVAVRVREGCAKLSVVGAGMRGTPGVVREVVEALSGENVEIIHCTDSNVTISVLVPASDAARGERAIHAQFRLDAGEVPS